MIKKKINLIRNEVVDLPNGRQMQISYIQHPGAVVIVPFIKTNTIMMMRQFRPAIRKYHYELPAGTLDPKESISTCARRELIEETGLRAKKITKLGFIYPVPSYSTEIIYIFKAEQLTQGDSKPEEYEVIQTFPMTKTEIQKLFKQGKIHDAKTICALGYCGWL